MKKPIVFVDQLAGSSPEHFGVRFYEEFSYWAWRACAIANVAMVLASEGLLKETLYELICEALLMDGYAYKNRHGVLDVGWQHKVLCRLLEKRGFKAHVLSHCGLQKAQKFLEKGKYVILSVKSESGGHMVLVKSVNAGKIVYNDPYCFKGCGGEDFSESLASFKKKFLGKGLTAW